MSEERDVLETEIENIKSVDDWSIAKNKVDEFIKAHYKRPISTYLHKALVNKAVELLK